MKFNRLGHSGLQVSALGLGTNAFGKRADEQTSIDIIHAALDQGINFKTPRIFTPGRNQSVSSGWRLRGDGKERSWLPKQGCRYMEDPGAAALPVII